MRSIKFYMVIFLALIVCFKVSLDWGLQNKYKNLPRIFYTRGRIRKDQINNKYLLPIFDIYG